MHKNKSVKLIVFSIGTVCLINFSTADDELGADAIAQRRFDLNRGWGNMSARLKMELTQGSAISYREMEIKSLEQEASSERTLINVQSPADLKGTTLLTYTHDLDADEQWLYLPAIKRVKRIALESKGGAFLSSQFNFEDLSPFQVRKYSYRRLPDETCAETRCYVIESTPKEASSVYGRLLNWITLDDFRLTKTQFFDRQNRLYKTLEVEKYSLYRQKFWKPIRLKMTNNLTGTITTATWDDLQYNEKISPQDFDVASLKRVGL